MATRSHAQCGRGWRLRRDVGACGRRDCGLPMSSNDTSESSSSQPRQPDGDEVDQLLADLEERLEKALARPPVQFSAEEQKRIEMAGARSGSRAKQNAVGPFEDALVRSARVARRPLIDALIVLLKRAGTASAREEAHHIALALQEAAGAVHAGGRWQQNRYTNEIREAFRENSIRTTLFSDHFNARRRKVGRQVAAREASKFWHAPLTRAQRRSTVRFRVAPWEAVIGDALIDELTTMLGRRLRFSVAAAKGSRFTGPDLRVLREAMTLARTIPGAPQETRRGKGVQAPGTEHWFANRLRSRRIDRSRTKEIADEV
jgi:hypothetical protein